jgi:S1-C subfamily serine protease
MRQRLVEAKPNSTRARLDVARTERRLGEGLVKVGQGERAKESFQQGLKLTDSVLATEPENGQAKNLRLALRVDLGLEIMRVVVQSTIAGGQARQIGLEPGDVIAKYAGQPVANVERLQSLLGKVKGANLELEILRAGKSQIFHVNEGKLGVLLEDRVVAEGN